MFGRKKPEVLVVGAGPTGLCAALTLARRGIRVQVIDKDWRTGARSYALALHAQSVRVLEKLDLLASIQDLGVSITRIGLYDGPIAKASIRMGEGGNGAGLLVVLPQYMLEAVLEAALEECGVSVLWNHELSKLQLQPDKVVATIDKLEQDSVGYAVAHAEWIVAKSIALEVPFVIGADGHRSCVRRSLGIEFPEVAPPQYFAVFEFQSNFDSHDEMRMVMGDGTTDVLWPLPNRCFRWSFELREPPQFESRVKDRLGIFLGDASFPSLGEDKLQALITERAPWFSGSIERMDWQIAVRFEHRLASAFSKQRAGLAGDAVHLTGPIGVQSMNGGLAEAHELAEVIADALQQNKPGPCLEDYNQRSLATWRHLLGLAGGLRCNGAKEPWISARAGQLLSCLPASGPELAPMAKQLGLLLDA